MTKCKYCGYVKSDEVIPAAHKFSAWKTTKAATVFEPAEQTRSCSVCGNEETRSIGKKLTAKMKVNATKLPLKVKQKTKALKVSGLAKGDSIVSWKSGNKKVVTVSSKGTVKAKKKGKAVISVKSGSKTVKCKVTVK